MYSIFLNNKMFIQFPYEQKTIQLTESELHNIE